MVCAWWCWYCWCCLPTYDMQLGREAVHCLPRRFCGRAACQGSLWACFTAWRTASAGALGCTAARVDCCHLCLTESAVTGIQAALAHFQWAVNCGWQLVWSSRENLALYRGQYWLGCYEYGVGCSVRVTRSACDSRHAVLAGSAAYRLPL